MPGRVTGMPATAQANPCGFNDIQAFGQGCGKASVEGVTGTGGFDDRAGVERWNVMEEGAVFSEDSLTPKVRMTVRTPRFRNAVAAFSAEARSVTWTVPTNYHRGFGIGHVYRRRFARSANNHPFHPTGEAGGNPGLL